MEIYTSYFYQIRNFNKNIIPLSTAIWDPQWFHQFKGPDYYFLDKNNVWNGFRIKSLRPNESCEGLCRGKEFCNTKDPVSCKFLKTYEAQLREIDKNLLYNKLEIFAKKIKIDNPTFCFIVYEAPTNKCSEREAIQKVFGITEWRKDEK